MKIQNEKEQLRMKGMYFTDDTSLSTYLRWFNSK